MGQLRKKEWPMEHRSFAPDIVVPNDDYACGNKRVGELAPDVAPGELRQEKQVGGPVNCSDSELSIYLQALAEGFLPTFYSDTSQCAQSRLMSIASKSYRRGKQTVLFHGFPSLQMSQNLTDDRGAELLMSFAAGFRAKTSAQPEKAQALTVSEAECGRTWPASLAKYDPDTSSWRTAQYSLLGGLDEFSETWPKWGLMRSGECWERPTLAPLTSASGSGLWPTPVADDAANRANGKWNSRGEPKLSAQVLYPTPCANSHTGAGHGPNKTGAPNLQTVVAQRTYPTATATAHKGWSPNHNRANTDDRLDYTVEREAFSPGQQIPPMRLNPDWVEWLMGWPIGHTVLKPLETAKFREWQQQHSIY